MDKTETESWGDRQARPVMYTSLFEDDVVGAVVPDGVAKEDTEAESFGSRLAGLGICSSVFEATVVPWVDLESGVAGSDGLEGVAIE